LIEKLIVKVTGCAGGCVGCCIMPIVSLYLYAILVTSILYLLSGLSSFFPEYVIGGAAGFYLGNALIILPAAFVVAFLGVSLALLKRNVRVKMSLQGALVAGEPEHAGGPSTCRSCGAPLSLQPGKICVPCYYCSTQNLVALDSSWVKQVKEGADLKIKSLTQAINYFEDQNNLYRGKKIIYTAVVALMLLLGTLITLKTYSPPVQEKTFDFLIANNQIRSPLSSQVNLFLDIPVEILNSSKRTGDPFGYFQKQGLRFYLPLKEKEALIIECLKPLTDITLDARFSKITFSTSRRRKDKEYLLKKSSFNTGQKVEFTAPGQGFYSLFIDLPPDDKAAFLKLKFSVKNRSEVASKKLDLKNITIHDYSPGQIFSGKNEKKTDENGLNIGTGRWAEIGFDNKNIIRSIEGRKISFSKEEKFDHQSSISSFLAYYRPESQLLDCEKRHVVFTYKQNGAGLVIRTGRGVIQSAKILALESANK
jgi:hypothetical protein